MNARAWVPLLDRSEQERVWTLARTIAEGIGQGCRNGGVSLSRGSPGHAVFLAELYAHSLDQRDLRAASEQLERVIDMLGSSNTGDRLVDGLSGAAWSIDYAERRLGDEGVDRTAVAEDLLRKRLAAGRTGGLSVLEGICGVAPYFLGRLPGATSRAALEQLLLHVFEASEQPENNWSTWWTPLADVPASVAGRHSRGRYDLTMGTGVAGIAAVLWQAERATICSPLAGRLFRNCLQWMLGRAVSVGTATILPLFSGPGVPTCPRAAGWSESTAAVLAALLPGALATDCPEFVDAASQWVLHEAQMFETLFDRRPCPRADLLGGSAGLAHSYNRIFQLTGDGRFAELAVHWLSVTASVVEESLRAGAGDEALGFLDGLCGAALVLLAGVTTVEPAWDRALLLSASNQPMERFGVAGDAAGIKGRSRP